MYIFNAGLSLALAENESSESYTCKLLSYTLCFGFSCLFGIAPPESPDLVQQMSEKDDEEYIYEVLQ